MCFRLLNQQQLMHRALPRPVTILNDQLGRSRKPSTILVKLDSEN